MQQIPIAGTELVVSELCFGTAQWGSRIDDAGIDRLVDAYLSAGGNFLDTAHCYAFWLDEGAGLGKSEMAVGRLLRRRGLLNRVVVATKGGHSDGGKHYHRPEQTLSRHLVERDLRESLDRLELEQIDLYYLHRDDGITPVDEVMLMLNEFIAEGHIRYIGASNWCIDRLTAANEYARARGLQGFCCSQVQWSLANPKSAMGPDPTCRHLDEAAARWHAESQMPVMAYSPTGRGFFATGGKARDDFDLPINDQRLSRVRKLAAELGCTPNQVALAWLRNEAFPVVAILGTLSREHLDDAIGACAVTLSAEQVKWLWQG